MKKLTFFIGLLLTFNSLSAQKTVRKNYNTNGISEVNFNFKFAENIEVRNWNKNNIRVVAQVNLNDNTDNDKFILQKDKTGGTLKIKSDYKDLFKKHKHRNLITRGNNSNKNIKNFGAKVLVNYTVYIPKNINVKVKSISGNIKIDELKNTVELDLVSGNINVKKHSDNMNLKTVSGNIDIVVNNAEFKAQTITGNVYSDLKIDFSKSKKRSYSSKIAGIIANGNAKLRLKTVSGNVLLRKQ